MDGEANLPTPGVPPPKNLVRTINNADTTSSSSSSFSSSSSPDFLRHVQAALKRHRPHSSMQTNSIRPRRMLVAHCETSKTATSDVDPKIGVKKFQDVVPSSQGHSIKDSIAQTKNPATAFRETQEDITPSISSTITKTFDESFNPSDVQKDKSIYAIDYKENNPIPLSHEETHNVDGKRKVQFSMANNATSQEMEWDASNQVEILTAVIDDMKHQNFHNMESDINLKTDGVSVSAKRTMVVQDQQHQLRNFLSQPSTQSSVLGPSCATTTSIHSTSSPMLNSTTYCPRSHAQSASHVVVEPLGDLNSQHRNQRTMELPSCPSSKDTNAMLIDQTANAVQVSTSTIDTQIREHYPPRQSQGSLAKEVNGEKNPSYVGNNPTKQKGLANDVTNLQFFDPLQKIASSDMKLEPPKQERHKKVATSKGASAPRKKNYDPDMFFKVNGKLYQRLGKIGSGGSSEVHKVISSDCTIYALKKIKLKGRDYATAYGFCQEIEYLNKLKGKNNIIQLIDYEVTDEKLLLEVMNGSVSNKDSRVKDDGYIYMVLEYGEIDLAHMLSQKWKEVDSINQTIDENWLRFYWQQILQAVNTIHEERIVHSDLKPANFLLVKGFLKLIDFGIAKAIMSDTTNIQRDSQVGTLSYMSPEAFLCNESDGNGNIIKCGRPSDIWSLGCILYQMVYGRTPFAEYKTFWAKFKVITDPNHEITYGPVSNPWLLDLMKKCLAWDRNERCRIPQLLQHPFLVPPLPPQPSVPQEQGYMLLQLVAKSCASNEEASKLCCELQQLLKDPVMPLTSREQQCKLLSQMGNICLQLRERLSKLERK